MVWWSPVGLLLVGWWSCRWCAASNCVIPGGYVSERTVVLWPSRWRWLALACAKMAFVALVVAFASGVVAFALTVWWGVAFLSELAWSHCVDSWSRWLLCTVV